MNVYSIDYEIYIWFKTNEGLRLHNYRVTWDSTNIDNGYHVDVFKKFAIPNEFIPVKHLTHIITSDVEVHYFFLTNGDNKHNIMMLKHTDLINNDFSRIEIFNMDMKVDVENADFRNNKCRKGSHVIVYKNMSDKNSEGIYRDYLPNISDPPLANNIFATHFRSAYPFVTNGRKMKKPNYENLVQVIIWVFSAALLARLITLGYDVLPTQLARKIRMKLSVKHRYIFKSLAKRSRFFLFLYKTELFIWKNGKKLYNGAKKIAWFEGDNEEELRPLMASHGQDQPSTRESSTPNE
ncbi:hypothetical protein PRIPAC_74408 [Pristionchus pacificus]|nr:hypothetical protein PRIPAC_74408 [Pristionchus pacificus]